MTRTPARTDLNITDISMEMKDHPHLKAVVAVTFADTFVLRNMLLWKLPKGGFYLRIGNWRGTWERQPPPVYYMIRDAVVQRYTEIVESGSDHP